MKGFIITAPHEQLRLAHVQALINLVPFPTEKVLAVYPSTQRIPFQDRLLVLAYQRTGYQMTAAELACLLSHRKVWRKILNEVGNTSAHYLILESDAVLLDPDYFKQQFNQLTKDVDLFLWGGYEGRIKLFESTLVSHAAPYQIGEPFLKSMYCAYGYSLNKETARLFLKKTGKISYPVDHYKRYFYRGEIKIRSVLPEIITANKLDSNIPQAKTRGVLFKLLLLLIEWRNQLITKWG
jgi:GR25 family glycosyltransferase involved in LPS biosynthesis